MRPETTLFAHETVPYPLAQFTTTSACLARVRRINVLDLDARGPGLVRDEALQLPERPAVQPGAHALAGLDALEVFKDLDSWIRHRLRAIQLKFWRRGTTIYRELRRLGADHDLAALVAGAGNRWWHCSLSDLHRVLTVQYFDRLGIPRLSPTSTSRTARCGPACRVVWEGSAQ